MKITIITPTYNSEATISKTINSIIAQQFSNLEYIIIDGKSTDKTLEIIDSYRKKIDIKLISEKDDGIYDAMNKGIKMATGDIVGILNSDDFFNSDNVLNLIHDAFNNHVNVECVYGDIIYFSVNLKKNKRVWRSGVYKESKLKNGWTIPHPAMFVKLSVYSKFGLYNKNFKIAGDYEFILRIIKLHKIKTKYIPTILVRMYSGGTSGINIKNRMIGWKELKMAWRVNNLSVPPFFILRRLIFKIKQFI